MGIPNKIKPARRYQFFSAKFNINIARKEKIPALVTIENGIRKRIKKASMYRTFFLTAKETTNIAAAIDKVIEMEAGLGANPVVTIKKKLITVKMRKNVRVLPASHL
jgi:hypothetical protein